MLPRAAARNAPDVAVVAAARDERPRGREAARDLLPNCAPHHRRVELRRATAADGPEQDGHVARAARRAAVRREAAAEHGARVALQDRPLLSGDGPED